MELSVVIASHRQPLGLYLTVFSVIEQLTKTRLSWEIVIAADGGDPSKWENLPNVRCLRIQTGSPQGTRDAGIRAAASDTVLVMEDHTVVSDIGSLLNLHKALGGAITVPYRVGETGEFFSSYGYTIDWDRSFWVKTTQYRPQGGQPYRIAGFGHAVFMVSKSWYLSSGGYCLEMKGWGGEEVPLTLKAWHLGREVWMVPSVWHAHFLTAGAHGGTDQSEDFKRNFCIGAYVCGGDGYLLNAQQHYNYALHKNPAIEAERQRICAGQFGGDLDKLREFFKREGIVN